MYIHSSNETDRRINVYKIANISTVGDSSTGVCDGKSVFRTWVQSLQFVWCGRDRELQLWHGVYTLQPAVQPVGWTMQMSAAKRRLSGPARTLMRSLGWRAARRLWTVDDVARLIEILFKKNCYFIFIYLLYEYSKRFVQSVVQPAGTCKRTTKLVEQQQHAMLALHSFCAVTQCMSPG